MGPLQQHPLARNISPRRVHSSTSTGIMWDGITGFGVFFFFSFFFSFFLNQNLVLHVTGENSAFPQSHPMGQQCCCAGNIANRFNIERAVLLCAHVCAFSGGTLGFPVFIFLAVSVCGCPPELPFWPPAKPGHPGKRCTPFMRSSSSLFFCCPIMGSSTQAVFLGEICQRIPHVQTGLCDRPLDVHRGQPC